MLFRQLIPTLLGAALVASAGAAAIAEPGGAQRELVPTAKLSANGGLSAPSDDGGGIEAGAPIPVPAEPAPVEAPEPAGVVTAPPAEAEPEPVVPEPVAEQPVEEPSETELSTPEPEPVEALEPPAQAEVLEGGDEALVPVEMLSSPVGSADEAAPLIDLTPDTAAAEPFKRQAELEAEAAAGGEVAQTDPGETDVEEDDGEIIIPIDPDDIPDGDDGDETDGDENGGGQGQGEDDTNGDPLGGLPTTGRPVSMPLVAGILLLLLGAALRMTAPSPSSRPQA